MSPLVFSSCSLKCQSRVTSALGYWIAQSILQLIYSHLKKNSSWTTVGAKHILILWQVETGAYKAFHTDKAVCLQQACFSYKSSIIWLTILKKALYLNIFKASLSSPSHGNITKPTLSKALWNRAKRCILAVMKNMRFGKFG